MNRHFALLESLALGLFRSYFDLRLLQIYEILTEDELFMCFFNAVVCEQLILGLRSAAGHRITVKMSVTLSVTSATNC